MIRLFAAITVISFCGRAAAQLPPTFPFAATKRDAESSDRVTIRRVVIPPERVPVELAKAKQKLLVQIPRQEFEGYMRRAAQAEDSVQRPVRLEAATYRAVLLDATMSGTASWTVHNPAPSAGILTVEPFNLAIRDCQLDNSDAILGELNGRLLGLFVELPGVHHLTMNWTARGEAGPDGLRFDFRLPSCTLTSFEFDLPADCKPSSSRDASLLSGPFPSQQPDRRLWRLANAGRTQIDLVVRRVGDQERTGPMILSRSQATETLAADGLSASFSLELEMSRFGVREIVCECAPQLKAVKLNARNAEIESWEQTPATPSQPKSRLRVRLREPFEERFLQLKIDGRVQSSRKERWICPGLSVFGATSLGETITLRIPPELQLQEWEPGDFVLARATSDPHGFQTLTLESGLSTQSTTTKNPPTNQPAPPSPQSFDLRRPSARIVPTEGEFQVRQIDWWYVNGDRSTLTVDLLCEQTHGNTFELKVSLPSDWKLDRIESSPSGTLQNWAMKVSSAGVRELTIDLGQALEPGKHCQLRLRLTPSENASSSSLHPSFPQITALGARSVDGILAVRIDPRLRGNVETSLPTVDPRSSFSVEAKGTATQGATASGPPPPWGDPHPDHAFRYQDQAPTGSLSLQVRRPRVRAQCTSDVVLAAGHAAVTSRLHLQPVFGQPRWVDLCVSAPIEVSGPWKCDSKRSLVQKMEPLPTPEILPALLALGGHHPVQAAASLLGNPALGEYRRITFSEALSEPVILETTWTLADRTILLQISDPIAACASNDVLGAVAFIHAIGQRPLDARSPLRWQVPLITVLGADSMEGKVNVHLAGSGLVDLKSTGLEEDVRELQPGASDIWKAFRYRALPVSLELSERTSITAQLPKPRVERATLTTYVARTGGQLLHRFGFQMQDWNQRVIPVQLPAGVSYVAARVDGRWITSGANSVAAEQGVLVELPAVAGSDSHFFEVFYVSMLPSWRIWTKVTAPVATLPLEPTVFSRSWNVSPDLTPVAWASLRRARGAPREIKSPLQSLSLPLSVWPRSRRDRKSQPADWQSDEEGQQDGLSRFEQAADDRLPRIAPADSGGLEAWMEWEPAVGAADEGIILVRRDLVLAVAWGLTITLFFAAWRIRNHAARRRYGLLLLWLCAATIGLFWLPDPLCDAAWWPLGLGLVLAASWYVWSAIRITSFAERRLPVQAVAALAGLVLGLGLPGRADGPAPRTVFLVSGEASDPEKQTVLLPPDLLNELKTLAGRRTQQVVLVGARYSGSLGDGIADLKAEFRAYCFTAEPAVVWLPLTGVELQEASLDGKPAYPETPDPARGFRLPISGKGHHSIECRFTAAAARTIQAKDLRIGIPELPDSRVTLTFSKQAIFPLAVQARGAQHVDSTSLGVKLSADLGRLNNLHVRWFESTPPSQVPSLSVRELYFWDIQSRAARLFGVLQYRVVNGAPTELAVDLPEHMLVRRVEIMTLHASTPAPRLKSWTTALDQNQCRLRLEFQSPIASAVQILVELVPTQPIGSRPVLPLPFPVGADSTEGFLAFRVDSLQASVFEHRRITGIEPSLFSRMWRLTGGDDPGMPERAYSFRRAGGAAPYLQLELKSWAILTDCAQKISLRLSGQDIKLEASATLKSPKQELIFVDWIVPEDIHVVDVTGRDIRSWSRLGSHLHVWLENGVREAELSLRGTASYPPETVSRVSVPRLYFPGIGPQSTVVRVLPEEGVSVSTDGLKNLSPMPSANAPSEGVNLLANDSFYGGTLRVQYDNMPPAVRIVTLVELKNREFEFSSELNFEPAGAWPDSIAIRLKNWSGAKADIQTSPPVSAREFRSAAGTSWLIDRPAGIKGPLRVSLRGALPLASNASLSTPDISVDGRIAANRWLLVAGPELTWQHGHGLTDVEDIESALRPWPSYRERARLGAKVWRITDADWGVQLRPKARITSNTPRTVQVLLDDQRAVVVDGRGWLHTATYWLFQGWGSDLGVRLPRGAALLRIAIDGKDVAASENLEGKYWLPMTGRTRFRTLSLYWKYPVEEESLYQPRLDRPVLERAELRSSGGPEPAIWTIYAPAGCKLQSDRGGAIVQSAAHLDLRHAAAQLSLSRLLAEVCSEDSRPETKQQLRVAQVRFYHYCRAAESHLRLSGDSTSDVAERLANLLAANKQLAESAQFEEARLEAEKSARTGTAGDSESAHLGSAILPPRGLTESLPLKESPTYWSGPSEDQVPTLRLETVRTERRQRLFGWSAIVLIVSLILWMLSYYPLVVGWIMRFWPEECVLAGCAAWAFLGPTWPPVVLLLLGASARLLYAGVWGLNFLFRPRHALVVPGSGVSQRL
jgi:hypothetical protein